MSMVSEDLSNPPPVVAIKLNVISRCRGRMTAGGREKVVYMSGYSGSENQSPTAHFFFEKCAFASFHLHNLG